MGKVVQVKSDIIGVDRDAYLYLERICRKQRGCRTMTEEQEDRIWRRQTKNTDGLRELHDHSIGGGDGTYYGRWTEWSVETIRSMLKEAGLSWTEYGSREWEEIHL